MPEPTIKCPKCKAVIKLTEAVAGEAIADLRAKLESDIEQKAQAIALREKDLEGKKEDLEEVIRERSAAAIETARRKVEQDARETIALVRKENLQNEAKLQEAAQAQAVAESLRRELEAKSRELDLEIERRVSASQSGLRSQAQREADERYRLIVAEKERTISEMNTSLEEARRQAEQGSQKAQGEVLELDFEATLRRRFPEDAIAAVSDRSGQGDIHQQVRLHGKDRGLLLWELKRTKNWSGEWLPKLRGIQREIKATVAIVCSQALPDDVETFELVDGVWVCAPRYAFAVAAMLRHWLIDVDRAKAGNEGQKTKAEIVYQYMTGAEFKHRVEAVVEPFQIMREDLEKEQRGMTRLWAKRAAQLDQVQNALAGLYGDLQGIAGSRVAELPALSLGPSQGQL